jgi:hypothetical protein
VPSFASSVQSCASAAFPSGVLYMLSTACTAAAVPAGCTFGGGLFASSQFASHVFGSSGRTLHSSTRPRFRVSVSDPSTLGACDGTATMLLLGSAFGRLETRPGVQRLRSRRSGTEPRPQGEATTFSGRFEEGHRLPPGLGGSAERM